MTSRPLGELADAEKVRELSDLIGAHLRLSRELDSGAIARVAWNFCAQLVPSPVAQRVQRLCEDLERTERDLQQTQGNLQAALDQWGEAQERLREMEGTMTEVAAMVEQRDTEIRRLTDDNVKLTSYIQGGLRTLSESVTKLGALTGRALPEPATEAN